MNKTVHFYETDARFQFGYGRLNHAEFAREDVPDLDLVCGLELACAAAAAALAAVFVVVCKAL